MSKTRPQRSKLRGSQTQIAPGMNQEVINILERITDGFVALDNQWRFTYINSHAIPLFLGKRSEEMLGNNIWEIFPRRVGSNVYQNYHQARATGLAVHFEEWFGPDLCTEQHAYPSKDGLSIYMRDITERKKLEKYRDDFISLASHELKTPVTTLKGFAQLLQRRLTKQGDIQSLESLERMVTQIDKITLLINDLLDISRIQAGKLIFREACFNLAELLKETVEILQETVSTHQFIIQANPPTIIYGDRDRVGQVLINLLTNAVKFSPQARQVLISVQHVLDNAQISIQDFGIGIPADQQKQIFERFYQVSHQNKDLTGLGIGLYISNQIVQYHNGQIWVDSITEQGSTFHFTLPLFQQ